MSLRCLLFSSDEGVVRPIQQALAELGMEAQDCSDAAEAALQGKGGGFQILIADWNRPETADLLAGAKESPSRERPLILVVVSDAADTKAALRAGANSTLRRPLEAAQVRDTLDMARDLLRAKASAKAAAAAAGASTGVGFAQPAHDTETHLRAGEFLSNASTSPGAQFQVEAEAKIQSDHALPEEQVKPLIELEPMAAAVGVAEAVPEAADAAALILARESAIAAAKAEDEKPKSLEELLRSRRQSQPVAAPAQKSKTGELLNYGDMQGSGSAPAARGAETSQPGVESEAEQRQRRASEAELFNYVSGKGEASKPDDEYAEPRRWMRPGILAATLALAAAMAAVKIPQGQWHQNLALIYGMGNSWLNPPVMKPAEAPRGRENFGRAGDEYKLPSADPIPDATTDPSEIRVVPVVDPTLKTNNSSSQPGAGDPAVGNATAAPATDGGDVPKAAAPDASPKVVPVTVIPSDAKPSAAIPASVATLSGQGSVSVAATTPPSGIPLSLHSQIAPSDPAPGGVKPAEAALPAIEPVVLPESEARTLLVQVVPPAYPKTVAVNAQRGNVVVAVTLGRDGSVQDAKFQQGSLSFARSAIDAVRQWRFRPYLLNGRPVSVQTVLTITFSPPA